MDPNASTWTPSAGAASWTPGGATTPSAAAPPATPANTPAAQMESMESDIDENDPLWQAVLKIAEGDRARAEKMLADPDHLTVYPEILSLLESGAGGGEDWEEELAEDVKEKVTISAEKDTKMKEADKN